MGNWSYSNLVCKLRYNYSTSAETFKITDGKLYVPVVTLWTQDNTKLLQYYNNWNHDSNVQLTGINIYPKYYHRLKTVFRLLNWSTFSGKYTFCFIIWKYYREKSTYRILFSKSRSKWLPCYDWWKIHFWSASKKWHKNIWKQ